MALLRTATSSDLGPVIQSECVLLRTPQMSDYPDWAELRAASRDFLTPWEPLWAADELTRSSFRRRVRHYMRDLREDVGYALFIFSAKDGTLVGGLTLCNVRRGVTQACTLGYWIGARYARKGYMTAAVRAVIPFVLIRSSCTGSRRLAFLPTSPPSSCWRRPASCAKGWRAAI